MFTLQTVSSRAELERLETDWNALADRLGDPLLRHDWFVESARAFTPEAELSIHLARDAQGAIRAIAPLVFRQVGPVRRLTMLGSENYEPEAFPHDDPEALAAVCARVAGLHRPLLLMRLGAGSPELASLRKACRGRGAAVVREGATRHYANPVTTGDWKAFLAAMPAERRRKLERSRRKLEELGPVTLEVLAPDPEAFEPLYREFVDLEASGWKARSGSAIAQHPPALAFYRDYGRRLAASGRLRLFFLKLDGRTIAAQFHILHGGWLWALKIAYDEAYRRHSPGALITHEILRHACEQGLKGFDHMGEAEEWQTRWPVQEHVQSALRFYPVSWAGAVTFVADAVGSLRRRARSSAPEAGKPETSAAAAPPEDRSPAAASPPPLQKVA